MAKFNINEENDRLSRAGTKVVTANSKTSKARANKLKDPETKKAVLDFIFGGNPEAVSPLDA